MRALFFLLVFATLQQAWEAARGSALEYAVLHDAVVAPAAAAVNWLTPRIQASAIGFTLHSAGGGVNVLNGCEGTELLLLVLAALVAAPLGWGSRWRAIVLAMPVAYGLAQVRLLLLFYAVRADRGWFDTLHGSVSPLLLVIALAAYVHVWIRNDRRPFPGRG